MSRYYVSTSYYYVTIFFSSVFAVYCMVSPWVHWHSILNISPTEVNELDKWVFWVVLLFVLRFILQLLSSVLLAYQKSFINDLTQFSTSLIMLIVCYLFKFMHILNFYSLLVVMCGLPVVVLFGYTIFFYATEYKQIRPSLKFVRHDLRKDLFSLGLKFFIIQIVALTIFSTTNILIAQLFDISMVTTYNIAYKYYNITVMVFAILISPMWGAFTNAWYQGDHKWVRANIKRYVGLVLLLALANVVQHFFYPLFIKTWLKRTLDIPLLLSISFIVYNFIFCYNDIFAHFLASIGQLNRQIYAAVLGGILNIPLTIYLAKHLHLGISAILIANVVCLLPSTIVTTLQTFELLSNKKELKTDQISP